ncbi:MAG: MarR family transcriptional regulator [Paracoccaceae bacterium]|nr:MarR family transcriptional regulator [Paracoccaceae bacterium]
MRLRAWLKILKTSSLIEKSLREQLRENCATTLPRFDVMSALARAEKGLKMSQLSLALKVSNGNVTGIVDRLVTDGFVIRVAVDGDRRAHLVRLSIKGRQQFALFAAAHERWIDEMLGDLSPQDAEALIGLLSTVIDKGEDA